MHGRADKDAVADTVTARASLACAISFALRQSTMELTPILAPWHDGTQGQIHVQPLSDNRDVQRHNGHLCLWRWPVWRRRDILHA